MEQVIITIESGQVSWSVTSGMRLLDAIGAIEVAKRGIIDGSLQRENDKPALGPAE